MHAGPHSNVLSLLFVRDMVSDVAYCLHDCNMYHSHMCIICCCVYNNEGDWLVAVALVALPVSLVATCKPLLVCSAT